MNNRIPIYMITSYEVHNGEIHSQVNWGFYYCFKNAEKAIKDCPEDFFEHCHNYIVIEELFPGLANCGRAKFYKYNSEIKNYNKIVRPEFFNNKCGFFC